MPAFYVRGIYIMSEPKSIINAVSLLTESLLPEFGMELVDVEFQFEIEPELINAHGPVLLQVLLNLVSNAIKYGDKPKTVIQIALREEQALLRVSVADNGSGIDSRYHDKLFQLFETASTVDRFGKRGNGIGLATVKKLILRAGGHIQFNTESGKGTTFEFTMSR